MIYRPVWSHWIWSPLEIAQIRPAVLRAPGQATEIVSWRATLAVTWQEFGTLRRLWCLPRAHRGILCLPEEWPAFLSHQPGTQPCISAAWTFRSPKAQMRDLFLPCSLPSLCYCFSLSLQNASWLQSRKPLPCFCFPDQISPKSIYHHICICHSVGFSFSIVEAAPDLSPRCHLFWSSLYQIIF